MNTNEEIYNDNYIIYLQDIANRPLLSDEKLIELFHEYYNGDINAKNKIIESNLRLVINIVKECFDGEIDFMDLIQEGNLALQKAVETFNTERGLRFSTYAYQCIKNRLISAYRTNKMIAIPKEKSTLLREINKFRDYFYMRYGREPMNEEISIFLGIDNKRLNQILNLPVCNLSLNDKTLCDDDSCEIQDLVDDKTYNLERIVIEKDFWNFLDNNKVITPLEKELLIERLNLKDYGVVPFKELERKYHKTSQALRMQKQKALQKIKRKYYIEKVKDITSEQTVKDTIIDMDMMNKISMFLPKLHQITPNYFFSMVKINGLLYTILICFCFGYINSRSYYSDDIANILNISNDSLSFIAKELMIEFKNSKEKVLR